MKTFLKGLSIACCLILISCNNEKETERHCIEIETCKATIVLGEMFLDECSIKCLD